MLNTIIKIINYIKKLFLKQEEIYTEEKKEVIMKYRHPLEGDFRMSSPYGERKHPIKKKVIFHQGVDYATPEGTPIYAMCDADTYVKQFQENKAGIYNSIYFTDEKGERYRLIHMHLKEALDLVGPIKKGDLLGYTGNTGSSTGPHIHIELRKVLADGTQQHVDPFLLIPIE